MGMVMEVIFDDFAKFDGNTVTASPIVIMERLLVVMVPFELQLMAFQCKSVKPVQAAKALLPMLLTLMGIVIDVSPVHP